jgi:DNA-binding NtrC family response regulator
VLVSFPFMTGIIHYDFPYNVRELESLIKRWAAVTSGQELDAEHLTDEIKERMKTYGLPREAAVEPRTTATAVAGQPAESGTAGSAVGPRQGGPPSEQALRELLARHQGNIAAVGRELGKERVQVHRWLRRYGIDVSEYRPPDD